MLKPVEIEKLIQYHITGKKCRLVRTESAL